MSLEREELDLCHVKIDHLKKLLHTLHLVLKGYLGLFVDIAKLSCENGLVLTETGLILVSELKTLVKLYFKLHICCNGLKVEDVVKVVNQVLRIDSLDFTAGEFRYFA